jgi:iron complex outermembrane recepter protein
MRRSNTRRSLGALCGLAILLPAHGAAQQAARDTTSAVPLEPVVVTVLRTPFPLTGIPYSVAVNTEEEIQRGRPGLGLDEALRGIPGVQVDNRYNYSLGERISIRGMGARAQFGVRGIKVLVDGIPATLPDGQTSLTHVDMNTVGRAEVIRGPASSLYGNTAGGVIQFESREPGTRPLGQEVQLVTGSDGLLRLNSTTGGRSGRASYAVSLGRLTYDGYRAHNAAENRYVNARGALRGERSTLRVHFNAASSDAQNPGSLDEALLRADRLQALPVNLTAQAGKVTTEGQLGAIWQHRRGAGEWEVAGYGGVREVVNPIVPTIIDLDRRGGGLRTVYRSDALPRIAGLQWSVGAEADRQVDDRTNFRNLQGTRGDVTLDQLEHVDNLGVFGQLAATPLPRVNLLGGLRYDVVRFRADDRLITATNPDDSGERTMSAVSPSMGVSFLASPALTLYGNVATAFQTPTTTELANRPDGAGGFNPELEPQLTVSFEAGAKGQLGARAAYQLVAYRAEIENALIPFEVPNMAGRQFFRNAGTARHDGVEAGLTLAPLQGVRTQLAYTYTDARFTDYVVRGTRFDGNRIPGVAPHRVDLIAGYTAPRGWFTEVEHRRVSRMAVNDANTAYSPAYGLTDLRAGLDRVQVRGLELSPFVGVSNVLDTEYNTSVVINATANRFFEPGPGRALYLGLRAGVGMR